MAETPSRPWLGLLARRVVLPGALLGAVVVGAGNAYVLSKAAPDLAADVASAPARPVAIVLGNTVFPGGHLSSSLADRCRVALNLYQAGKVQKIFLSGAYHPETPYDEPGAMAAWLERRGVPRAAMVLDRDGHRTAATMANAAAQGFREVLICTQAFHLPRSLYLARHAGMTATGVPAKDEGLGLYDRARSGTREWLARAETVLEVAVRGVKAH
jgi:vancomycin permeability regulator SanA